LIEKEFGVSYHAGERKEDDQNRGQNRAIRKHRPEGSLGLSRTI
jgi:hypothetical protein